jgi:hypothetical protein
MVADSVHTGNTLLTIRIAVSNVRFIFGTADGWILQLDVFPVQMNFTKWKRDRRIAVGGRTQGSTQPPVVQKLNGLGGANKNTL